MKLKGKIEGVEVILMIDPRATNNFISHKTIQQLNLPYSALIKFGVTLGNGERIQGERECKALCVEVPGLTIMEDFLILELGNSDVIIGLQWLEKSGKISTDWKKQVMRFSWEGHTVELRGDPFLGISQISLKAMERMLKKEKQGLLIELNEAQQLL